MYVLQITPENQLDGDSSAVVDDLIDVAKEEFSSLTMGEIKKDTIKLGRPSSVWGIQFKSDIKPEDMPKDYKKAKTQISLIS